MVIFSWNALDILKKIEQMDIFQKVVSILNYGKKVFWPSEGKRFTSKVRANNISTDILTGLGADMVSTITPALVELLANTLNSLEW